MESMDQQDADLEQLTALVNRAGLRLSADELAKMAPSDQRTRGMLRDLRTSLAPTEEPAAVFTARSDA
jgi:hypothetical protein